MLRLLAKLCTAGLLFLVLALAYLASPFISAWTIREAIRTNDAATLSDRIDWPSLRDSLKPSLHRMALDLPPEPSAGEPQRLGMWKRLKAYLGRGVIDRTIDGYVTPEGLPQLLALRKAYRAQVAPTTTTPEEEETQKPLSARLKAFWSRVVRAEFVDIDRFELDVIDKNAPDRLFAGVLEWRGTGWKLTELRIRNAPPADAQTDAAKRAIPTASAETNRLE